MVRRREVEGEEERERGRETEWGKKKGSRDRCSEKDWRIKVERASENRYNTNRYKKIEYNSLSLLLRSDQKLIYKG